jgi:Cas7 group CRISPR-associated protein Csh2
MSKLPSSRGGQRNTFNRGTGLLVIEVRGSNPNGDPDSEGEPRTLGADRRGLISPVSFKRKLRDLLSDHESPIWNAAQKKLQLSASAAEYDILETRGRDRDKITRMDRDKFIKCYWDARVFGNTFLESMKGKEHAQEREHFITTGVVQFGPGVSVAPVETEYQTWTNKAGVQEGKDRGMAPLAWRFIPHGLYVMPFFVNPLLALKSGCSRLDIELMKFLIPFAYSATASVARPNVALIHAWYAEHKTPLGSCPDNRIIDEMTPKKRADLDQPSRSVEEYEIPTELSNEIKSRLASFEDLCARDWPDLPS